MIRFRQCFRIVFTSGASFSLRGDGERKVLVTKRKGPWDEERREVSEARLTRLLLPAFLCAQIFIEKERHLGTRKG